MTWDPAQYLKYSSERLRPALDLIARIRVGSAAHDRRSRLRRGQRHADPRRALARGAGRRRRQFGGDAREGARDGAGVASHRMAARPISRNGPRTRPAGSVDLVYSNAALHWLADHATLFPRALCAIVAKGGALAVQMPSNFARAVACRPGRGRRRARGGSRGWDALRRRRPGRVRRASISSGSRRSAGTVDAWTTEYLHVLPPDADGEHPVDRLDEGHGADAVLRGPRCGRAARLRRRVRRRASRRPTRRCRTDACSSRSAACSSWRRARIGKATGPRAARERDSGAETCAV